MDHLFDLLVRLLWGSGSPGRGVVLGGLLGVIIPWLVAGIYSESGGPSATVEALFCIGPFFGVPIGATLGLIVGLTLASFRCETPWGTD